MSGFGIVLDGHSCDKWYQISFLTIVFLQSIDLP